MKKEVQENRYIYFMTDRDLITGISAIRLQSLKTFVNYTILILEDMVNPQRPEKRVIIFIPLPVISRHYAGNWDIVQ